MRYRQMATAFAFLLSLTAQAVSRLNAMRNRRTSGSTRERWPKQRPKLASIANVSKHSHDGATTPPRSRRVTDQPERALERAVPADHTIPIRLQNSHRISSRPTSRRD